MTENIIGMIVERIGIICHIKKHIKILYISDCRQTANRKIIKKYFYFLR